MCWSDLWPHAWHLSVIPDLVNIVTDPYSTGSVSGEDIVRQARQESCGCLTPMWCVPCGYYSNDIAYSDADADRSKLKGVMMTVDVTCLSLSA
jgi:hypothetical protein